MAPEQSLTRARRAVLDQVARKELTPSQGAAALGISKSWFYALRSAYERHGGGRDHAQASSHGPSPEGVVAGVAGSDHCLCRRAPHRRPENDPGPVAAGSLWQLAGVARVGLQHAQSRRTAFRYRFYGSADDVDTDLQAWLRLCNYERPDRGYRTRGRPPAAIHYANRPDLLKQQGWNPDDIIQPT